MTEGPSNGGQGPTAASDSHRLVELLGEVKLLAVEYYRLTQRPLGVTGEIAEYEAARLLGLERASVRQTGWDATYKTRQGIRRLQIKGRRLPATRVPRIDLTREWDAVLLVLLDEGYEPAGIYEAGRADITAALTVPGSRARNERGQLGVSQFKSIAQRVWP